MLPMTLRVTEVHLHVGRQSKALLVGDFVAPTPDERAVELDL